MRPDIEALLAKLGQSNFRYQIFTDVIADVDSWPLFTAVLEDERVVGSIGVDEDHQRPRTAPNFISEYGDREASGLSGLARAKRDRPEIAVPDPAPEPWHMAHRRQTGSLRAFLTGLSDAGGERR